MDDFEYSVQISEQDWDTFFQECEECNLLPPVLAGPDDSGMSDMDEIVIKKAQRNGRMTDPDSQIEDSPPDYEGSPVELYLSKYGTSPMQILSGSEDDLHMEAVNVFFERLKNISTGEDSVKEKASTNVGSEVSGILESCVKKEKENAAVHDNTPQISSSGKLLTNEQQDMSDTFKNPANMHECTLLDTKLVIKEEKWSLETLKEEMKVETNGKWEKEMSFQQDVAKSPCLFVAGDKEVTETNYEREISDQSIVSCNSDTKGVSVSQCQPSSVTPRKRRRKKKRVSIESTESDFEHEAPFQDKESDDEIYMRRGEIVRDTHSNEFSTSGTLSEPFSPLHASPPLSIKVNPLQNFPAHQQSLQVSPDITVPVILSPNSQKTLPDNIFIQKTDFLSEKNDVNEKIPAPGQCPLRADLTSSESNKSVEPLKPHRKDSTPASSNVEQHLHLNNQLALEIMATPNTSDVLPVPTSTAKIEQTSATETTSMVNFQLLNMEDLRNDITAPRHTDNVPISQTNSMTSQLTSLLSLGPSTCSNSSNTVYAQSQIGNKESETDQTGVLSQAETSQPVDISLATFPEITKKSLEFLKNAEEEGKAACMIHCIPKHSNGHVYQCEENLLETPECESVTKSLITQMNTRDTLVKTDRSPGAEIMQNTYSLIETEVEDQVSDKAAASNEPVNNRNTLHSESDDLGREIMESVDSHHIFDLTGNKEEEFPFPAVKNTNAEVNLKDQIGKSLTQTSELEGHLDLEVKTRHSSSNIGTINDGKSQIQYEDRPSSTLSEDQDLTNGSPKAASPSPEPEDEAKNMEKLDLSALSPTPRPVYAMSSFWNEMEKLTINDILRLRMVGQAQHSSVFLQPEDNSLTDISEAADSGYFALLDDAKPERSSGDMSFISDFDEELAQLQTLDAAKLGEGAQESRSSGDITWESDLDPSRTGMGLEDVFMLDSGTSFPSGNVQQCFRKMCKNMSVQNLQALESQPLQQILRNTSMHSLHSVHSVHSFPSEAEEHYIDPFDHVEALSPVHLSDDEDEMESSGITFSEIVQYLFGSDEPERSASVVDNVTASYLNETGTSVPETYDQFFSEFEAGSFFYPLSEDTSSCKDDVVPIFSCSRSACKTIQFPEVYDYFFPDDSPVHSDEDDERDQATIRVITRYDYMETKKRDAAAAASDMYEHILPKSNDSWSFLNCNPFSFGRTQCTDVAEPPEKSEWALTPLNDNGRSTRKKTQPINAMGLDERPFPDRLLLGLENSILTQLSEQQKICNQMQIAVANPTVDASLVPLKQADMCLVCIAFASWVLKSASPQGDAWKAILLANVSALSAIRYLRKYMRDEAAKKTPLRQIESS